MKDQDIIDLMKHVRDQMVSTQVEIEIIIRHIGIHEKALLLQKQSIQRWRNVTLIIFLWAIVATYFLFK